MERASSILTELGTEGIGGGKITVRLLASALVQIRNKTKGHGALYPDFFQKFNQIYLDVVNAFLENCPLFTWRWLHLSARANRMEPRGVSLEGVHPRYMKDAEVAGLRIKEDGIYIQSQASPKLFFLSDLLKTTQECRSFSFPNGNFNSSDATAENLDYESGRTERYSFSLFASPPVPLPSSETQGLSAIDVQSNVFGNLPALPRDYVARPALENELSEKLCDQNHEIISLHGHGGMGKTYLALAVAHGLAASTDRFENVIWFSARDLDLRTSGPKAVKPQVVSLSDVFSRYGQLFDVGNDAETFSFVLQGSGDRKLPGTLFIFDNFETMEDLTELHRFLDQHTTSPNKVLLTTRERAFKADYPIEVKGMEKREAKVMLTSFAHELGVTVLFDDKAFDSIYEFTAGHPYIMKVLIGEMAKERRFVPPGQLLSSRVDVANAVFERSFNKLTDDARAVFLSITNWRSMISELSLLVVLGSRGVRVEKGLDECSRLSLISSEEASDGQLLYFAPELARGYGKKKLSGDPDKLVIQADLESLRRFGVTSNSDHSSTQKITIDRFIASFRDETKIATLERKIEIDRVLETLASLWKDAWLELAKYRRQIGASTESIEAALRRSVEESPEDVEAWLERADFARASGNDAVRIASLVSAVEADPNRIDILRETAFQLAKYIREQEIPPARRSVYLSSVRSHMQKVESQLDAVGLSRLAWLFMLDGDKDSGRKYATLGLSREPGNNYCLRIIENIESWG